MYNVIAQCYNHIYKDKGKPPERKVHRMKRKVMSYPMYNGRMSGEYITGEFEGSTIEELFQKAREAAVDFFGDTQYCQIIVQTKREVER